MHDQRVERLERQLVCGRDWLARVAKEAEVMSNQDLADDLHMLAFEATRVYEELRRRGRRYQHVPPTVRN